MFDLIARLLSFFYDINNSYVVAIILLTLVVLVVSTPLTLSGTRSMLKMQLLQPELKAIQDKYGKDERQEMNVEMMEFYKENNINPVGGCLPLLFQIPVFLVLYRVILGITRRATDVGSELGEVAGSAFTNATPEVLDISDLQPFNPAYISQDSQMFMDLTATNDDGSLVNTMDSFGFDLARSASQVLGDGIVGALPYLMLIFLVFISGWFQHQMIRRRQTGASINPTQEMIMKFMPFFLPVFAFTLPAAIVFYFLVSNLYRIAQQYYITRSMYSGDDSLGAQLRQQREDSKSGKAQDAKKSDKQDAKKPTKKSPSKASKAKKKGPRHQGSGQNGGKSGRHRSTKNTASSPKRSNGSAPGRNSSGREASARGTVEPKARKSKKKR